MNPEPTTARRSEISALSASERRTSLKVRPEARSTRAGGLRARGGVVYKPVGLLPRTDFAAARGHRPPWWSLTRTQIGLQI